MCIRDRRRERQTSETEEQREVRLQRMCITHSERMAVGTEEQREARLQRMRANQSDRLAVKTEQQREARLQRDREGQQQPQLPLLEQPSVQAKMRKFRSQFSTLDVPTCTTCSKGFPGLKFHSCRQGRHCLFSAKALTFICNFRLSVYTQSEHLLSTYVDCIMIL